MTGRRFLPLFGFSLCSAVPASLDFSTPGRAGSIEEPPDFPAHQGDRPGDLSPAPKNRGVGFRENGFEMSGAGPFCAAAPFPLTFKATSVERAVSFVAAARCVTNARGSLTAYGAKTINIIVDGRSGLAASQAAPCAGGLFNSFGLKQSKGGWTARSKPSAETRGTGGGFPARSQASLEGSEWRTMKSSRA